MHASPPSTMITEESAERRSAPREQLRRMLKGDLSAIVLKALEQDPGRRYESVRQFATDVSSFLEGPPGSGASADCPLPYPEIHPAPLVTGRGRRSVRRSDYPGPPSSRSARRGSRRRDTPTCALSPPRCYSS